jgi:hypothetical protein
MQVLKFHLYKLGIDAFYPGGDSNLGYSTYLADEITTAP